MNGFYVSYASLMKSPVEIVCFGKIHLTLRLCQKSHLCVLSLPVDYSFHSKSEERIPLGSSFILEYNSMECEVVVGRQIRIVDDDTYISQLKSGM